MDTIKQKQWPGQLTVAILLLPIYTTLASPLIETSWHSSPFAHPEALNQLVPATFFFVLIPGLLISALCRPNTYPFARLCALVGLTLFATLTTVYLTFWW